VYLALLLDGYRDEEYFGFKLPTPPTVILNDTWWEATIPVPPGYFPPKVTKFNAAAQHGDAKTNNRHYELVHPQDPDKHPVPDL
jgi:hypothetical protein